SSVSVSYCGPNDAATVSCLNDEKSMTLEWPAPPSNTPESVPPWSTVNRLLSLPAAVKLATLSNVAVMPPPDTLPALAPASSYLVPLELSKMTVFGPSPPSNEIAGAFWPANDLASMVRVVFPGPVEIEIALISLMSPNASTALLLL